MDPSQSQLDLGFSQQDTPCLIVEDSQPESAVIEEDTAHGCISLLALHLPNCKSPVLVSGSSFAGGGKEVKYKLLSSKYMCVCLGCVGEVSSV